MSEEILLSVLVPGLPSRLPIDGENSTEHPLTEIHDQCKAKLDDKIHRPVEILYLLDNKMMSVGRKRSILLNIAQGRYFTFVDDDDEVSDGYVDMLLAAIREHDGVDVICFKQDCIHVQTGLIERCEYSLGYAYENGPIEGKPNERWWKGLPAHTMAWRTDLVNDIPFPDGNFGEDTAWVKLACERAKTEHRIDKVLYNYRFNEKRTETRD